ncbi:MAG TPA: penicillin-binding transpeptidase domain-containing protein [Bryobacteraceae bacterium]|nr:penicillin-binding transpeptidase domain-containing protein [Bryobacteraceae bacterium]
MYLRKAAGLVSVFVLFTLVAGSAFAIAPVKTKKHHKAHRATTAAASVTLASFTAPAPTIQSRSANHLSALKKKSLRSPWTSPTFADSTDGDSVDGEDLVVRRAAVAALGPYNGSIVVVDPKTGRLLTIVNQKLAYQSGFQPCSTIKVVAALAGLNEGVIDQNTKLKISRHGMGLTEALAHSNNAYFSSVGYKLGYDRIIQYAQLFGLGEKAGLDLDQEQPGMLAAAPPADGVGMMTSFGEGIYMTPLELAAVISTVANGGTLYYLQHPRSKEEIGQFVPRVKRQLDIAQLVPEIRPGMHGAVEYGTARRAGYVATEPIFGKTGTCTDGRSPTHLGWFGSFNELGDNKLVVVVLLTGGHQVNGPVASGVAGAVYRNLSVDNYFAQAHPTSPVALVSNQSCCN